jgi:tetratricopeptide (TPR) repeat protein
VLLDRTERLFRRGQQALDAFAFDVAADRLQQALDTDPGYAHVALHLAIAHAELEHLDVADSLLQRAMGLDPSNFVCPMYRGVVHLDAGQLGTARAHLQRAAALAPGNILVAGYLALADWDEGRRAALAAILPRIRDLPNAFCARLLVRVEERRLAAEGSAASMKVATDGDADPDTGGQSERVRPRVARWRVTQARVLMRLGAVERAAEALARTPESAMDDEARALLYRARTRVLEHAEQELSGIAPPAGGGERRRRRLLLRVANARHDMGDEAVAYRTVDAWLASYEADGAPARDAPTAAELSVWAAGVDVANGRFGTAIVRCARSRRWQRLPRIEWVDAIAHLGGGDRRHARWRFHAFLDRSIFDVRTSVEPIVRGEP